MKKIQTAKEQMNEYIAIQREIYLKDNAGFRRSFAVHKSKKDYNRKKSKKDWGDIKD